MYAGVGADMGWCPFRSSKPFRPDSVGLGGFDSHTLPPRRAAIARLIVIVAIALVASTSTAAAQVPARDTGAVPVPHPAATDTIRTQADTIVVSDTTLRPPISARRAFLYSFLVPGLGQARLDRAHAGAFFMGIEAMALAMAAKSGRSLDAARLGRDSVIVRYDPPTTEGGDPIPVRMMPLLGQRLESRRTQVEDWIAVLIANHLFAGADAFVAAQLWDLPRVIGHTDGQRTTLALRFTW